MLFLSDTQKGYIAGLIDGEGWIGIHKSKNHYSPKLAIGMTHYETLSKIQQLIGGNLREATIKGDNSNRQWVVSVSANILRELLPQIMPLMVTKKLNAIAMIEYLSIFKSEDRDSMSGLKAKIKDEFCSIFHRLNMRGIEKCGELRGTLTESILSQALREIGEKVHRLRTELLDIKKNRIMSHIVKHGKERSNVLFHNHFSRSEANKNDFAKIMDSLKNAGTIREFHYRDNPRYVSYILCNNVHKSAARESDDIVRANGRPLEVSDKEPVR